MNKILATVILILSAATVVPAAATDDRQHAQLRLQLQQGDRINARIASDGCSIGVQLASAAGAGGLVVAHRLRDRGAHDVHSTDHRGQWSKPHHARRGVHLAKHVNPQRGGCDVRHHHHGDSQQRVHGDGHRHSHSRR
jgi:hypothetical protein